MRAFGIQGVQKNEPIRNRYISKNNYGGKLLIYHSKASYWNFFIACRFLLFVKIYDHDKS